MKLVHTKYTGLAPLNRFAPKNAKALEGLHRPLFKALDEFGKRYGLTMEVLPTTVYSVLEFRVRIIYGSWGLNKASQAVRLIKEHDYIVFAAVVDSAKHESTVNVIHADVVRKGALSPQSLACPFCGASIGEDDIMCSSCEDKANGF